MGSRQYRRGDKEYDKLQKLQKENEKLKRRNAQLQKIIDRIDWNQYTNVKELMEKHQREDQNEQKAKDLEKAKKTWECWQCRQGFLKIQIFTRLDGTFYKRKCTNCDHHTRLKPWNDSVGGIKDGSGEETKD